MLRGGVSSFVQGLESGLPSLSGDLTIVRLPFIVLTPKGLGVPGRQLTQFPLYLLLPYATFSACQLLVCFQL